MKGNICVDTGQKSIYMIYTPNLRNAIHGDDERRGPLDLSHETQ
jgi:hypothetical protein